MMNIGSVSRKSGVSSKTIRYYESVDLIPSPARSPNGYRVYDEVDVQTLRFIQRARGLGFSVAEVANLLDLWHDKNRTSAEVKSFTLKRIEQVERKIGELETIRAVLSELAERCQGDERPECPILEQLARDVA